MLLRLWLKCPFYCTGVCHGFRFPRLGMFPKARKALTSSYLHARQSARFSPRNTVPWFWRSAFPLHFSSSWPLGLIMMPLSSDDGIPSFLQLSTSRPTSIHLHYVRGMIPLFHSLRPLHQGSCQAIPDLLCPSYCNISLDVRTIGIR